MALPNGYTKLDYIQSTGTQYIDTGVKADQAYSLEIKFQTSQASAGGIAVSDANWQSNGFGIWCNSVAFGNQTSQDPVLNGDNPIVAKLSQDGLILNGSTAWTPTSTTFSVSYNMTLFALNRSGSLSEYLSGRIYYVKISSGAALIRDFIPCINASGTVGLYDQVGNKFYGNSGTGVFFASPQRQSLPAGYTQVEYLQSSGTQYIDTGYLPNQNTRVVIDEQLMSTSTHLSVFGTRKSNTNLFWIHANNSSQILYGYGSYKLTATCTMTNRLLIDANKTSLSVDDGSLITATSTSFTSTYNMYLFGVNSGGAVQYASPMMLYSCKIYDNSTLVRNFVPCVNVAGVAGLYDTVGKQFYQNAGTGTFTVGDALPDTSGVYVKINGTWKQVNNISVKAVT